LVEPYEHLRQDLIRTTYAAYATELLDKFSADEDKNIPLYELLKKGLGWFNQTDNIRLAARYYELRLLGLVGFQPQLFRCVVTNEPITEEEHYFSAELGGLLKPSARGEDAGARWVSATAVKLLRYLQTREYTAVEPIQLRPELHRELEQILHYHITYHLERHLKSVEFLHRLRREATLFTRTHPPRPI
jgi:DNA repair protein RecO (recombination protein O)